MRADGVPLNEVTYTSLITELTRLRALDRIVEVVMGDAARSQPPVMRSWQQEINALAVRAGGRSSPWLRALPAELSAAATTAIVRELVGLLSEAEKVDAALDILEAMLAKKTLPPADAVKAALQAVERHVDSYIGHFFCCVSNISYAVHGRWRGLEGLCVKSTR